MGHCGPTLVLELETEPDDDTIAVARLFCRGCGQRVVISDGDVVDALADAIDLFAETAEASS